LKISIPGSLDSASTISIGAGFLYLERLFSSDVVRGAILTVGSLGPSVGGTSVEEFRTVFGVGAREIVGSIVGVT
jgi:hypothetical protein